VIVTGLAEIADDVAVVTVSLAVTVASLAAEPTPTAALNVITVVPVVLPTQPGDVFTVNVMPPV
jgi:hypothetical protein